MKRTAKRRGSLVVLLVLSIGAIIAVLNTLQITFLAEKTKKSVTAEYQENCNQITAAYAQSLENKIWGYFKEMDVYVHSEVVRTGDVAKIGEWLASRGDIRSSDFDYVIFAGADGIAYTDLGKRVDISDRSYFSAIMVNGKESYIDNPVISKTTNEAVYHVVRAVKYGNKIIGFFAGVVTIKDVGDIISRIRLGKTGTEIGRAHV